MKINNINLMGTALALVLLVEGRQGLSQGTFVNLDFEHPVLPLTPGLDGRVSITNALPGWTGYMDGLSCDRVFYDDISLGAAAISLHDTNSFITILQGRYTVLLQPSFPGGTIVPAIGQVGTVPSTARSVRFYEAEGIPSVWFAGQQIALVSLGSTPTYTILGGDVSGFAGQTGELRFQGGAVLDNIFFSTDPIPEPSVLGLSALAATLLGWRFWHRRR